MTKVLLHLKRVFFGHLLLGMGYLAMASIALSKMILVVYGLGQTGVYATILMEVSRFVKLKEIHLFFGLQLKIVKVDCGLALKAKGDLTFSCVI